MHRPFFCAPKSIADETIFPQQLCGLWLAVKKKFIAFRKMDRFGPVWAEMDLFAF